LETTDYTHDPAGNILTETDSASVTVTRTYDAVNRVLQESYPDSTQNATYTYDATTSTYAEKLLAAKVEKMRFWTVATSPEIKEDGSMEERLSDVD
jgi:YD repeat-containing protein